MRPAVTQLTNRYAVAVLPDTTSTSQNGNGGAVKRAGFHRKTTTATAR